MPDHGRAAECIEVESAECKVLSAKFLVISRFVTTNNQELKTKN